MSNQQAITDDGSAEPSNTVSHSTFVCIAIRGVDDVCSENDLPNQEASLFVSAIGSVWLVSDWNVIAGNPKPMPDDKFDTFAKTLMRICNERRGNQTWAHEIKNHFGTNLFQKCAIEWCGVAAVPTQRQAAGNIFVNRNYALIKLPSIACS